MLSRFPWGSLSTKIIVWSFTPAAVLLVVVALVNFYAYQQVTEDLAIKQKQEVIRLATEQMALDLAAYTDELDAIVRKEAVYTGIQQRDSAALQGVLKQASNRLVIFDAGVLVLDDAGTVVASEPEQPHLLGHRWPNQPFFQQALRSPRPTVSGVVVDGATEQGVIAIAVPIVGARGTGKGLVAGLFQVGSGDDTTFTSAVPRLHAEGSGSTYLVDGHGRVIYHSDGRHVGNDFSAQAAVQRVLDGEVGVLRTHDLNEQAIVASFAPIAGTDWGLISEETWAVLMRNSQGYQQLLLILLGCGVAVSTALVAISIRRITRPIQALIDAAQEVAEGKFDQRIEANTGDEVAQLARQFNRMAAQLQESYTYLEQRIADRTRELTVLYDVTAVASESLELSTILNRSLERVLALMGCTAGAIHLVDEAQPVLRLAAWRGVSPGDLAQIDLLPQEGSLAGMVVTGDRPLVVDNIAGDDRAHLSILAETPRTYVGTPMHVRGRVIGVLSLVSETEHTFGPDEVVLLDAIADQIGVAVENARLYEETRRRLAESQSLQQVTTALLQKRSLEAVLEIVCNQAQQLTGASGSTVYLLEDEIWLQHAFSTGAPRPPFTRIGVDRAFGGVPVRTGEPVMINDFTITQSAHLHEAFPQLNALLSVPLVAQGKMIGALNLVNKPAGFDQEDVRIIRLFADQAAIAIEKARLDQQAEQLAVMQERNRLARDLHDSVTQSLYSLVLITESGRRLMNNGETQRAADLLVLLGEAAQQALKEMRLLVYELRPLTLIHEGLLAALQYRLDTVERRANVEAHLISEELPELPVALEEELYWIAQEGLNNVLKHAQATQVTVQIHTQDGQVELEIIDNGAGFDPVDAQLHGGIGLSSMRERAEQLGGSLSIQSAAGQGTRVKVCVNVEKETSDTQFVGVFA